MIVDDLRNMTAEWDAPPAVVIAKAVLKAPFYPAFAAVMFFRISSVLYRRRVMRPLAHLCKSMSIAFAGAEIHPAASIREGFALIHSVGIVIGHDVRAGRNLAVYHGVTIGHDGRRDGQPMIGDDVRVYAGAKVLGPVKIGDRARIGANAVVLADVQDDATVVGVWTIRT